jgi:hypothetical protein
VACQPSTAVASSGTCSTQALPCWPSHALVPAALPHWALAAHPGLLLGTNSRTCSPAATPLHQHPHTHTHTHTPPASCPTPPFPPSSGPSCPCALKSASVLERILTRHCGYSQRLCEEYRHALLQHWQHGPRCTDTPNGRGCCSPPACIQQQKHCTCPAATKVPFCDAPSAFTQQSLGKVKRANDNVCHSRHPCPSTLSPTRAVPTPLYLPPTLVQTVIHLPHLLLWLYSAGLPSSSTIECLHSHTPPSFVTPCATLYLRPPLLSWHTVAISHLPPPSRFLVSPVPP